MPLLHRCCTSNTVQLGAMPVIRTVVNISLSSHHRVLQHATMKPLWSTTLKGYTTSANRPVHYHRSINTTIHPSCQSWAAANVVGSLSLHRTPQTCPRWPCLSFYGREHGHHGQHRGKLHIASPCHCARKDATAPCAQTGSSLGPLEIC